MKKMRSLSVNFLAALLLGVMTLFGQATSVQTGTLLVSGQALSFPNSVQGSSSASVTYTINGGPSVVQLNLVGLTSAGGATLLDQYTGTVSATRTVNLSVTYASFQVVGTWSGGDHVNIGVALTIGGPGPPYVPNGNAASSLALPNGATISGTAGNVAIAAAGANQNITLTPSGAGLTVVHAFADYGGQVFNVMAYGGICNGTYDNAGAYSDAIAAAAAVHGGIVYTPPCNGAFAIGSTINLGLAQSGVIFSGGGRYYNTPGASLIKWVGSANGTMFKLDGCYQVEFRDLILDGNALAGRGIQLVSSVSSTAHNGAQFLILQNFTGTPGYPISVGETAVSNVSENIFEHVQVRNSTYGFYQDGAQSFTWLSYFYAGSNTIGYAIHNGWFTAEHWEYGGTGIAFDIFGLSAKSSITDGDYEGTGEALQVEDSTTWLFLNFNNNRILWDTAASTPGTEIKIGVTTGATGTFNLENNKFSTLSSGSTATIQVKTDTSHSIRLTDTGSTYISSPSPTVLSLSGNVYYNQQADFASQFYTPVQSKFFDDFLTNQGYTCAAFGAASGGNACSFGNASFNNSAAPGILRIDTGTGGSGTGEYVSPNGTYFTSGLNSTTVPWSIAERVLLPNTSTKHLWGFLNSPTVTPTDGIYFYYDPAVGANWHCVTVASSAANDQDTGVAAAATTWVTLRAYWDGTTLSFYVNGSLVATSTTDVPSAILRLYWIALATSGTSTYIDADYVLWGAQTNR